MNNKIKKKKKKGSFNEQKTTNLKSNDLYDEFLKGQVLFRE